MDEKTRQALEARFPEDVVKKRRGNFGKQIHYVDGQAVVARLNDVFAAEWGFEILSHKVIEPGGEVLVHGRLTALGITKEAFGKSTPAISRDTGEVLSVADAYKAAATDALKKAASLLGVAAYLYSDVEVDPPAERRTAHTPRQSPPRQLPKSTATPKQLSAIWSMSRDLRCPPEKMQVRCQETFGKPPEGLSKAEASSFITKLSEELDANRRRQQEFDRSRGAA